ncbi:MAG: SPASM domain-containing protein [Candidatus Omnitrophota bacterium]
MIANLKEQEERVGALKESIIDSVNKRVSESVTAVSVREKNILLNDFEYALGKITLQSTPEGVGIGAHYLCNAQCIFCLGGKHPPFSPERYKNFFEQKLGFVIDKARYVNLCGFGELLLMPGIERFLDYLNDRIPYTNKIFTTNGTPLTSQVSALLTKSKFVTEISLHASSSQLHRLITRTNAFEQITERIRRLVSMRKKDGQPSICLVFLINTLNIENLPDFVEFAAGLGADEVICNYLTVFTPAHLKLSCFFKQEITNSCLEEAEERAKRLKIRLKLPPKFGRSSQTGKTNLCSDPWKYFYVENQGSVLPCCYAGYHVGYLNQTDFETIWNGANYQYLRYSLVNGQPHEWCSYCYRYRSSNVNDIRSHINFRPNLRDKVLKGV